VYQKPLRISSSLFCASATPVDSSIVRWAPRNLRHPCSLRIGARRSPYRPFRVPSRVEVAIALIGVPPAAITPTTANCEAPEKSRSESRQVCRTEKFAATAAAPNALPYAPTVKETLNESRFTDTPKVCPNTRR